MRISLFVGTSLALFTGGCDLDMLVVKAQARQVCITEMTFEVEGGLPVSAEETFVEDDLDFSLPEGADAEVRLDEIVLRPTRGPRGVEDFDFIDRLIVDLASGDPDATLPTLTVIDYQRDPAAPPPTELHVAANADAELIDYVDTGSVAFTVEFEGQLPAETWSVTMDACFTVSGEYRKPLPF